MLMSKRQQRKLNRFRDKLLAHAVSRVRMFKAMYMRQLRQTDMWRERFVAEQNLRMSELKAHQDSCSGLILPGSTTQVKLVRVRS